MRRMEKGDQEGEGREIQTRENSHEFVLCVADFSFVVVVAAAEFFSFTFTAMLFLYLHRQKEKSRNFSSNCLTSNLWRKWMTMHLARRYVFRFGL